MTQVWEEPDPAQPWHWCLGQFAGGCCLVQCSELINSCPAPKAHLQHKPNICCTIVVIKFITNRETLHTHFFTTTAGSEMSPKHSQATKKSHLSLPLDKLKHTQPHFYIPTHIHISGNIFINHLHHFPTEPCVFYYFRHLLPLALLSTDRASLIELHSL